jgi:hypothetical protein
VCQELHSVAGERIKALEHQAATLCFDYAYASSTWEESQRLLQQGDDVRVLQMKQTMRQQVQQVAANFDPCRVVPCRRVDFQFEEHKGVASVIAAAGAIVPDEEEEQKDGDAQQQDGEEKALNGRQGGADDKKTVSFEGSAYAFLGLPESERSNVNKLKITGWIGAEGARALADALKVSRSMTSVHLRGNDIGDDGTRALAELRQCKPALQISV